MRGEDSATYEARCPATETPPHAWGRPAKQLPGMPTGGNTPTCVGKTRRNRASCRRSQKHPHMRGEDRPSCFLIRKERETPPHAWGRRTCCDARRKGKGNTPTCVGKTAFPFGRFRGPEKHPHMRGEDANNNSLLLIAFETPPHAWGRPDGSGPGGSLYRNTPTCVGKTRKARLPSAPRRKHPHMRGEDIRNLNGGVGNTETPPHAWGRPLEIRQAVR